MIPIQSVINAKQVHLTYKSSECVIILVNVAYGKVCIWLVTNEQNLIAYK